MTRVLAIGDSILVGASNDLVTLGAKLGFKWEIYARVSRPAQEGLDLLDAMLEDMDEDPDVIYWALGTNGGLSQKQLDRVLLLARGRPVVLVTVKAPRPWRRSTNKRIRAAAHFSPNHGRQDVRVFDWAWLARHGMQSRYGWFWGDKIHLTPAGQRRYVAFALDAVGRAVR